VLVVERRATSFREALRELLVGEGQRCGSPTANAAEALEAAELRNPSVGWGQLLGHPAARTR
jgi:hypothetical protein